MIKKMHILFAAMLFTIQAQAPSVLWVKTYGGKYDWNYGESVVQTNDGGFIVAGYNEIFKAPKEKKSDIFRVYVVRTDSNGDTLWTREYGGEKNDEGYSIQNTINGGFVIAGYTWPSEFNMDAYLIRIDSMGDTLWTKNYGTEKGEKAYSVDVTKDGGFILAGETTYINSPSYSIYLVRTDSAGDTLWTKMHNFGDTSSRANSVIQTNDGGFAITGYTGSGWGIFMRFDSNGDILLKKIFSNLLVNAEGVSLNSIQQTNDGGFILAGKIRINLRNKVFLIRTNSIGDTLWTKTHAGNGINDRANSVAITQDGGFITTGGIVIKTDSKGDTLWTVDLEDFASVGWTKSIKQTKDGGYIVAGKGSADTVSRAPSVVLIRLDKNGTVIQKDNPAELSNKEGYNLFYNKKGNTISINYLIPDPGNVKLRVYDTLGRLIKVLVDKNQKKGSHTFKWRTKKDRKKLNAGGMYFLRLSANGHTVSKKITIVK